MNTKQVAQLPVTFESNDQDWSAMHAAEAYIREQGWTVGPSDVTGYRGVMFDGDYIIAKWKNLTRFERSQCDAVLVGRGRQVDRVLRKLEASAMSDLNAVWLLRTTARSRAIAACVEESGRARSVASRMDGTWVSFEDWYDGRAVAAARARVPRVLPVVGASAPSLVGCPPPALSGYRSPCWATPAGGDR